MKPAAEEATETFQPELIRRKQLIDADIEEYCTNLETSTQNNFGSEAKAVDSTYLEILKRGGKRLRGVLTMIGFEMCGGQDQAIALQTARVVEMTHAYMLLVDDIQDRSDMRRGGPSAHKLLEQHSKDKKWRGDAAHTGISLALNAALWGNHAAQMVLSNMDADQEQKLKALTILNHSMMVTAQGQTYDIINELRDGVTVDDVEKVMQWKTAHYSILNPIHMGMVMAGAGCEDTNGITEFAINAGKAFQATDDLLVVTGSKDSGKLPMDDIREGKITLLSVYALQNAEPVDQKFLRSCLGKQDLAEAEFRKCLEIFENSGAVDFARQKAQQYINQARKSLDEHADRWKPESVEFLRGVSEYILARTA